MLLSWEHSLILQVLSAIKLLLLVKLIVWLCKHYKPLKVNCNSTYGYVMVTAC